MRKKNIKFGYEIKTGKEIEIPLSHTVITGLTNESGKTTAVMGLIKRSGLKAVIIKTKIGEKAITEGSIIPPFYKESFDWEYASELLEASRKEKLKFERSWIIRYSKTAKNLLEFKKNIDDALTEGKLRELDKSVLISLQAYLDKILPELQYAPLSKTLDIRDGINIMDLERFKEETQTIIIRSVIQEVLNKEKNVLIVIPECLVGNTLILMEDGSVEKIKNIQNGQRVFGGKVSNRFTKQAGTHLKFSGSFELETTLTHPCFIIEKNLFQKKKYRKVGCEIPKEEIKIKLARDINKGDYFLIPVTKIPHKEVYKWTPEQLGFIGMILTDGNIRRGKNFGIVRVGVSKDVDWFREKFKEGLKAFGFEDTFKEKGIGVNSKRNKNEKTFWSNSKELSDILWSFGCFGGKKSNSIDISKQIFLSNLNSIAKFINICFCCDGNVSVDGFPRLGSSSEEFIKKMQFLLLKFGIISNIRKQSNKRYNKGSFWELIILRESVKLFKEKIGFDLERKQLKINSKVERKERYCVFNGIKYHFRPIKKIQKIKSSDNVYDFTTENHYFIANSILTHNCWKYLPERLNSPVKRPAEAFIRQGATNNNFLILDSQDITGVSKSILKQVSVWILGYQREFNEIKRTLDQIPLSKKSKPKPEDIATLKLGQFFVATSDFTKKAYSQPSWLDDKTSKGVAIGKINVKGIEQPTHIAPYQIVAPKQEEKEVKEMSTSFDSGSFNKKINELRDDFISNRNDFFNKFQQVNETISKIFEEIYKIRNESNNIDEDEIVMRVLQKIPITNVDQNSQQFDKESLIREVLSRVPKGVGNVVYEVAPLEKIKKDFLEEAKNKILLDIEGLKDDEKKVLKYIESKEAGVTSSEIMKKCFMWASTGGANSVKVSNIFKSLISVEVVEKTPGNRYKRGLRKRIGILMGNHEATEQEMEQVYNHILMEMFGGV